ncbi:hypothetical protein NPIL_615551 [Nephila pilipes]|uniref:Uncharacterized protein n=1 Tax=Nephila pilipes TaxID=299642 RepID=A0A8X6TCV6_NEPPI|nr:hypothetical protein NPIL_615551 [Nephila pilipes]
MKLQICWLSSQMNVSDSDEEFVLPIDAHDISDFNDDEGIVQETAYQQDDSFMMGNIIWENDTTSKKPYPFIKLECLLPPVSGNNPIDFRDTKLTETVIHSSYPCV